MTIDHYAVVPQQNSYSSSDTFGSIMESFVGTLDSNSESNHHNNTGNVTILDNFLTKLCSCMFWSEPWNICLRSLCLFDCNVNGNTINYSFCEPIGEGNCFCPHDFDYCSYTTNNHLEHYILACLFFIAKIFLNVIYCLGYISIIIIVTPIFLFLLIPICLYLSLCSMKNSLGQFAKPVKNYCCKKIDNEYGAV
jgi:hypothetical protein